MLRKSRAPSLTTIAALPILMIALASGLPVTGHAQGAPDTETPKAALSASEKTIARLEELRERRVAQIEESAAFDTAAEGSSEEDRRALEAQALELRLEGAGTLLEMAELLEDLDQDEQDAASQRRLLLEMLPALESSIRADYLKQSEELERLKQQRIGLDGESARAQSDWQIERQQDLLTQILALGIDVLLLEEGIGLPAEQTRARLGEQVAWRARIAASRVSAASRHLEDVIDGTAAISDPAERTAIEAAAKRRLAAAASDLESAVGLKERLGLDSTIHRKILISATGEVTVDSIDSRIASELVSRWATGVRESVASNGPNVLFQTLVFALILSIFWGLSRFVRKVVARAVESPNLRFSQLLKRMIVSLSAGAVLLLGLLIAFSQLGVEIGPMLAGLGIAGFVLGFALQDTLGNFASGVMILMYRPFDVGDMIDCAGGVFGKVSHMSLVSTTILTIDNKTLIVPNSKIWGDVITNVTAQAIRRVDLLFGIGYGDDVPKAERVLCGIIEAHPKILPEPEPVVKLHALGDSSVDFIVRPWVARDDYWDVYWDITREVKLAFDREGISIPFPQRDVHLYPAEPPQEKPKDA